MKRNPLLAAEKFAQLFHHQMMNQGTYTGFELGDDWDDLKQDQRDMLVSVFSAILCEKNEDPELVNMTLKTRRDTLLEYVGTWFDKCCKQGSVDEGFEQGKLRIELFSRSWASICHDGETLDIQVTPTFPLESI